MKNIISFFTLLILFDGCTQNDPNWEKGQIYKSEKLIVPVGNGQSGFIEMKSSHTGITASNQIGEKE
ncbi:MAG: hypothetical protein GY912_01050, partial [Candidatus Marinimicrobia bacterium]|nr:hypothetical protein [Candidatus Neomarinimicrobiota bacterium]